MSREIKFRAWFKEKNEMHSVAMNNVYEGNSSFLYLSPMPGSNFEVIDLMQYTGLKDKNGKEIFEGDIVQQNYKDMYNQSQAFAGEVVYSDCVYWLKNGGEYTFLYDEYRIYESVVIGNIYENPELLEETA